MKWVSEWITDRCNCPSNTYFGVELWQFKLEKKQIMKIWAQMGGTFKNLFEGISNSLVYSGSNCLGSVWKQRESFRWRNLNILVSPEQLKRILYENVHRMQHPENICLLALMLQHIYITLWHVKADLTQELHIHRKLADLLRTPGSKHTSKLKNTS